MSRLNKFTPRNLKRSLASFGGGSLNTMRRPRNWVILAVAAAACWAGSELLSGDGENPEGLPLDDATKCPVLLATTDGEVTTEAAPNEDGGCDVDVTTSNPDGRIRAWSVPPGTAQAILGSATDDFRSRAGRAIGAHPGEGAIRVTTEGGGVKRNVATKKTPDVPTDDDSEGRCRRVFTEVEQNYRARGNVGIDTRKDDGCDGDINAGTGTEWSQDMADMIDPTYQMEALMFGMAEIDRDGIGKLGYWSGLSTPYTSAEMAGWLMGAADDASGEVAER